MTGSQISGFYRMTLDERLDALASNGLISEEDARRLSLREPLLDLQTAEGMIENVVGVFGLPLAVATNIRVNGRDYAVPMVVEEPSIVAGISGGAKLMRGGDGISVEAADPLLIGQIQLAADEPDDAVIGAVEAAREQLIEEANKTQPRLIARGGGVRNIEIHRHSLEGGRELVVLHLVVDTRDAMGANLVNTLCEELAPRIEEITGRKTGLRILSNLADQALVTARASIPLQSLAVEGFSAEEVRDGIVSASEFAAADRYRAATHNKGIMNGVDALAIATGNDWRALEASVHSYAARDGGYRPLSSWSVAENGDLLGESCFPVKVGTVGGSLLSNAGAALGLSIAGTSSSRELAMLMGAVGLVQNFAALRALATKGIQEGHMRLHARSVATSIGTPAAQFETIVSRLIDSGEIKDWKARELLDELNRGEEAGVRAEDASVAAGKIILLGEHAAVYGKHVVALPIPNAVTATATEKGEGLRLIIGEWGIDQTFTDASSSDDGLAAILATITGELGVNNRDCEIVVSARIPAGAGLGSSASVSAAIARAIARAFSIDADDERIDQIAFACEQRTHGTPSGVDNTLAVYGRPIMFRKGEPNEIQTLSVGQWPPLVIGICETRASTREQVSKVRDGFESNQNLYARVFDQIDRLSVAGADALCRGDFDELGAMMNVCQGLLNGIQVSTPEIERMVDLARRNGALGAKLTGAGGGGAVVALCPGCEEQVASSWRRSGYDVLSINGNSNTNG